MRRNAEERNRMPFYSFPFLFGLFSFTSPTHPPPTTMMRRRPHASPSASATAAAESSGDNDEFGEEEEDASTITFPHVLVRKPGFVVEKIASHAVRLQCQFQARRGANLRALFDMRILELMLQTNQELFAHRDINPVSDNEVVITTVLRPLFAKLGLPAFCSHQRVHRTVSNDGRQIHFHSHPEPLERIEAVMAQLSSIVGTSRPSPIEQVLCTFTFSDDGRVAEGDISVHFADTLLLPPLVETMVAKLVLRLFHKLHDTLFELL